MEGKEEGGHTGHSRNWIQLDGLEGQRWRDNRVEGLARDEI